MRLNLFAASARSVLAFGLLAAVALPVAGCASFDNFADNVGSTKTRASVAKLAGVAQVVLCDLSQAAAAAPAVAQAANANASALGNIGLALTASKAACALAGGLSLATQTAPAGTAIVTP